MKPIPPILLLVKIAALLVIAAPVPTALRQVPDTLLHTIPAPPIGLQDGGGLGFSVAADGPHAVTGAPYDDTYAQDSGAVKVFDSTTGALLFVLTNPTPALNDHFGSAVAISGSRVAVAAVLDDAAGTDVGIVYVYDLGGATPTAPVVILNKPNPVTNDRFGEALAISGDLVVVGSDGDDTGADFAGSAYVFDLGSATPTTPAFTLHNPDPEAYDEFGNSVAISDTHVVVGAPYDQSGWPDAGSAYIYDLASAEPTVPVLALHDPTPGVDLFGSAVAISGTRLVVGASTDKAGDREEGSAYVYDLTSATPDVPVVTLNNPVLTAYPGFGESVAIHGTRVVVSAFGHDASPLADIGIAYVYEVISATPTVPVATLSKASPAATDTFGRSVAITDTRIVIGADGDDTAAVDAGKAYVYDLDGAPVTTLANPGPTARDNFGFGIAISGSLVVVGSPMADTPVSDAGSVFVFDLTSPTPMVPVFALVNPIPAYYVHFGQSVAISGRRVVVGVPDQIIDPNSGASAFGSAYVFDLGSATPTIPVAKLKNPNLNDPGSFGWSVAISGTRVVVGAYKNTAGSPAMVGKAYLYDIAGVHPTVPILALDNPSPASQDQFGSSVSISGTRIVVGAPNDDTGAINAGSAYIYDAANATPTVPILTLNNPAPTSGDFFGGAVAISGPLAVIGSVNNTTTLTNAGSVYVYDVTSDTPSVPAFILNNPAPGITDQFGNAVSVSGTRVAVGTARDDGGATDDGSAYVYDLAGVTPTIPVATLNNAHPASGDRFGLAVGIDGTTVAVGVPFAESPQLDKGAAYIFAPANHDFDGDGLLDIWEYARFGTTDGHVAEDDGDGDGRSELLEEGFNTDPLSPDLAIAPVVLNEGGYLTMTIAKRAGLTYQLQSAATPDEAAFSTADTTILIDSLTTLKARDNFPIETTAGRFMRVKVTAAP
jgi:hypothetical protein